MNWNAIAAVAELVGALGVIASVLYLAGQGCRDWWEKLGRGSMSATVREFIDAEIREVDAARRQPAI